MKTLPCFLLIASNLFAGPGEIGRPKIIPTFEHWDAPKSRIFENQGLKLFQFDGTGINLSELWKDKPVLIVHSSLTCPISRDNCPHVDRIKTQFADQIEVVVLYTTEAHPVGAPSPYSEGGKHEWITDRNLIDKILVDEPATLKARLNRAREYRDKQNIKSRLLVDNMDNEIWKRFGGGPNTAILIDQDGKYIVRQGWLQPSVMAGRVRGHFANQKRSDVRDALKKHGHEINLWQIDLPAIAKAAKDVPEVLSYNVNTKGACQDETLLHLLVDDRQPKPVSALIKLGAPIDGLDRNGLTPLHYAIRNSSEKNPQDLLSIIKLLLEKGASTHLRSDKLETATHFAVHSESLTHVKTILSAGGPLDQFSIDGISPLHEALFQGNSKIATHLIAQGASRDLFAAAALGDLKNVKRFLVNAPQAWKSLQGRSGRSPLMYATINGKTEIVEFLLSQQDETHRFPNEHLVACLKQSNDHDQVAAALLIANHALPLTGDLAPPPTQSLVPLVPKPKGYSSVYSDPIFHEVAASNHSSLLKLLLQRGWDLDALNPDHETPLHLAAINGATDSIEFLCQAGADINARAGKQRPAPCGPPFYPQRNLTPLHFAVINQQPDTVALLLKLGAKTELNDHKGKTPLCHALPNRYSTTNNDEQLTRLKKIVRLLVQSGADPDKPAECGKSFRDFASELTEKTERREDEWVNLGKFPRSSELLKFLDEL